MKLRKLLAAVLVGVMTVSSLAISAFAADEKATVPAPGEFDPLVRIMLHRCMFRQAAHGYSEIHGQTRPMVLQSAMRMPTSFLT